MAEDRDESQKSEEPTQKRRDDARKRGQVVSSREIHHWFIILAAAIAAFGIAPPMMRAIGQRLAPFIEAPHALRFDGGAGVAAWAGALALDIGLAVAPAIAILLAAAVAAGLLQAGPLLAAETIKPKLEKISPLRGLKRLFSSRSLVEFAKGLAKISIVAVAAWAILQPEFHRIERFASYEPAALSAALQGLTVRLLATVVAIMTVVAALDYGYQKFKHLQQLRMSRQELKDEYKESEGDPVVKSRLRQLRMERARRRMMQAVPKADVVITNPTHFAVALQYEADRMSAPKVVAKGADLVARRIREIAAEHKVPIVENPPLARALYAAVELDAEVPPEHYKAVAEVIGYVMKLRRGRPRANA